MKAIMSMYGERGLLINQKDGMKNILLGKELTSKNWENCEKDAAYLTLDLLTRVKFYMDPT
ncbi:MAG: hypothetical protein M3P28_07670 [Thermoproteota archaeon]|nr:hypothetical protein [Thermoproteota archaeon]